MTIFERENTDNAACLELVAVKTRSTGTRSLKLWLIFLTSEFFSNFLSRHLENFRQILLVNELNQICPSVPFLF